MKSLEMKNFLVSEHDKPFVEFNDDELPDLADGSDSDSGSVYDEMPDSADDSDNDSVLDSENDVIKDIEADSNEYTWSPVKLSSLPRSKRYQLKRMCKENYLEYDESHVPPVLQYVWKVDGLSRRPDNDSSYVRYYDASSPRPRDSNSFGYTLLSQFLSWAKPESTISMEDSSGSEGVTNINASSRSEGDLRSEGDDVDENVTSSINVVSPRRSKGLIGSSPKVPIKATVMRYKRILYTMHKNLPIRLTKKRKEKRRIYGHGLESGRGFIYLVKKDKIT